MLVSGSFGCAGGTESVTGWTPVSVTVGRAVAARRERSRGAVVWVMTVISGVGARVSERGIGRSLWARGWLAPLGSGQNCGRFR